MKREPSGWGVCHDGVWHSDGVRSLGQCAMGWAVGRAMGRTTESAMARALAVVPVGRVAGVVFMMLAVASPGSVVTSVWSLSAGLSPSSLLQSAVKWLEPPHV